MTEMIEYPPQSDPNATLWLYIPYESALVMTSKDYSAFGLNANYNWQKFLISFYTTDSASEEMTNY